MIQKRRPTKTAALSKMTMESILAIALINFEIKLMYSLCTSTASPSDENTSVNRVSVSLLLFIGSGLELPVVVGVVEVEVELEILLRKLVVICLIFKNIFLLLVR